MKIEWRVLYQVNGRTLRKTFKTEEAAKNYMNILRDDVPKTVQRIATTASDKYTHVLDGDPAPIEVNLERATEVNQAQLADLVTEE